MTAPAITAPPVYGARLNRETFRTSRLLEFCSKKELIAQTTGRSKRAAGPWPEVRSWLRARDYAQAKSDAA